MDSAILGVLDTNNEEVKSLFPNSQEALFEKTTRSEKLDTSLSSLAGILVRKLVKSLTSCAAVASGREVVACDV